MNSKPRLILIAALLCGFAALAWQRAATAQQSATPAAKPRKRALLVGISKYQRGGKDEWHNLNTETDLKLLKETLIKKFQFEAKDILILQGNDPKTGKPLTTKKAILDAFRTHLIDQTQPGDIVFFHFSGHGVQIPDNDPDEEIDGMDESLVPSDYAGKTQPTNNIRDDEIGVLLEALKAKQPTNVTITLDSCYSGTGTRGDLAQRGGDWSGAPIAKERQRGEDESASGMRSGNQQREGSAGTRGGSGLADGYVFLSAASPKQTAKETINEAQLPMGLFTWALVKALESAGPQTTYRDLHEKIYVLMSGKRQDQTPQLEGELDKLLLAGTALPPTRYISVKTDSVKKLVALQAGKLQGMTKGSKFNLHPAGAKDPKETPPLCEAVISDIELTTALLKVPAGFDLNKLEAARAFETEHQYDESLLRVALRGFKEKSPEEIALREAIRTYELAETVTTRSGADYNVVVHPPTPEDVEQKIVERTFNGVILDRADGSVIARIPQNAETPAKVREAIEREMRLLTVKQLNSTDTNLRIELRLVPVEVQLNARGRVEKILSDKPMREFAQGKVPEFQIGEHFQLEVRNVGLEPAYVTILNLDSAGKVGPGWPRQGIPSIDNQLPSNSKWIRIPFPYVFVVSGPTGMESFKAIATREPTDFSPLIDEASARGQRGQEAANSPLGKLLISRQKGQRRSPINADVPPAWATASYEFIIRQ